MVLVNPLQKEQKFPSKVLRKKTNGLSNNIENNKKNENRIPEVFYKKSEFFWQNSQENTFVGVCKVFRKSSKLYKNWNPSQ